MQNGGFKLSVVKPKPNQLHVRTNYIVNYSLDPICSRAKTKTQSTCPLNFNTQLKTTVIVY